MVFLDTCPIEVANVAEQACFERVLATGVTVYNHASYILKVQTKQSKKEYREFLTYSVGSILEPGFHHKLYLPTEPESMQKFGRILEFVAQSLA